ncbi:MAG: YraN family protein [Prevotella sp.]|jgi:putative endonuclease
MAEHNDLGKYGEDLAADYLQSKGYIILARDWHYGKCKKDIDIIAKTPDQASIVFVEVKTRRPNELVPALRAIDRRKIYNISQTANHYVKMFRITERLQYDAIIVHVDKYTKHYEIQHIERAFNPMHR